jgi:hypothetical protein
VRPNDFAIVRHHLGAAYGAVTAAALDAQRLLLDAEGIALETTYTAKSLAALLELGARPALRGKTLLFWNTFSSVDLSAAVPRLPEWRTLPAPFHRFFMT